MELWPPQQLNDMFPRFKTILDCDGQTDGQTLRPQLKLVHYTAYIYERIIGLPFYSESL